MTGSVRSYLANCGRVQVNSTGAWPAHTPDSSRETGTFSLLVLFPFYIASTQLVRRSVSFRSHPRCSFPRVFFGYWGGTAPVRQLYFPRTRVFYSSLLATIPRRALVITGRMRYRKFPLLLESPYIPSPYPSSGFQESFFPDVEGASCCLLIPPFRDSHLTLRFSEKCRAFIARHL